MPSRDRHASMLSRDFKADLEPQYWCEAMGRLQNRGATQEKRRRERHYVRPVVESSEGINAPKQLSCALRATRSVRPESGPMMIILDKNGLLKGQ